MSLGNRLSYTLRSLINFFLSPSNQNSGFSFADLTVRKKSNYGLWAKIFFLLVAYGLHGRPFEGLADYGFALLIAYFLLFGVYRERINLVFIAVGIGLLIQGRLVPQLDIPEQQRILMTEGNQLIPPGQFLKEETKYPYFITADGYLQGYLDKRLVHNIDIDESILSLRSGWINRPDYNFYLPLSPYRRADLPFVVRYEIIPALLGMTLDVEGRLLFEKEGRLKLHDPALKTISLQENHIGSALYGFGGQWDENGFYKLKIKLVKTLKYQLYDSLRLIFFFLGLSLFFLGMFFISFTLDCGIQTFLLLLSFVFFWLDYGHTMRWGLLVGGGMDGIIHGGFPYQMLDKWVQGAWSAAMMSPEQVFYFMPGMRYIRFIEMLLFGDSYIIQVCLLIFVPVILYRFLSLFIVRNIATLLVLLTFTYLLNGIGLSLKLYTRTMTSLYGEGFAYALLFIALTLLAKSIHKVGWGIFAFFLLAVSISIRPNLAIFVGIVGMVHLLTTTFSPLQWSSRCLMLLGISPVLLIPLHNILGGEFVLLTKASQIPENLPLSPKLYYQGLLYLLGLSKHFHQTGTFTTHFQLIYPQYALAWLVCLWLSFRANCSVIRAFSGATFAGMSAHLFYLPIIRYLHPYLTIAIVVSLSQIPHLQAKKQPKKL